jgi:hypothetical protein
MRDLIGRRSVPDIRQSEAAECGLACLAMVLGYHGHDVDLGTRWRWRRGWALMRARYAWSPSNWARW